MKSSKRPPQWPPERASMAFGAPPSSLAGLFLMLAVSLAFAGEPTVPSASSEREAEELNRRHMADVYFKRLDPNRDGRISAGEFRGPKHDGLEKQFHALCPDISLKKDVRWEQFLAHFVAPEVEWPGQARRNLVYKQVDGHPLLLDVYMPLRARYARAPVLYFLHGGGWEDGLKEFLLTEKIKAALARRFGEEGFCLASVWYRLADARAANPTTLVRDCVTDARDGLRYLVKHASELGIDANNLLVWGESAGAHLAMMLTYAGREDFPGDPALAAYPATPAAGISWFGPTDVTAPFERNFRRPGANRFDHRIAGNVTDPVELMARLREVSPWHLIRPASPPLLLMQGDQDTSVSPEHATHLKAKADQIGAPVELVMVENALHNWRQAGEAAIDPSTDQIIGITYDFAVKHLHR